MALLGRDRAPFIPAAFWHGEADDVLVDRAADPGLWRSLVNTDTVIVTQWNDGAEVVGEKVATCSCSMPTTVRRMLDALDVAEGHRVLEIGTGTGYTAALLADRVGPTGSVVSVEIDKSLADGARVALAEVGVDIRVITGDGLGGYAQGAPYDRVFVTCGIRQVPATWLAQARPGARIVLPWGTSFAPSHDVLVGLEVRPDGSACGRFADGLSYMKARSQRWSWPTFPDGWLDNARRGESELAGEWLDIGTTGFMPLVLGFLMPDVVTTVTEADGIKTRYLYRSSPEGNPSCAAISYGEGQPAVTHEFGPDDLATEFSDAVRWFREHGRPEPEGFGLTVDGHGGHVWFGSPSGPTVPPTA
ncbi:methyltransferase domain-containing protein [Yinghuangia sp. ASG 101]|uniref:methyltransferase domain-containing protein n=1 Tax=Yinghuangia sp. ASG 101 TaxID=2896848 RepID=UPI001E364ABE|nr:methyltransferase domain-containing protein [Yinghuangia sp. ASG 101]UGQ14783.1 methyltransferase domain-containing protein [Yinghuangia sp. ASG 101]